MTKTLIFAHRGANKEAAENTRSAFDKALAYPIDGIETDVQLSRDEVAVLWHDRFLGKLGLPAQAYRRFRLRAVAGNEFRRAFFFLCKTGRHHEPARNFWMPIASVAACCSRSRTAIGNRLSRHQIKVRQTLEMVGVIE